MKTSGRLIPWRVLPLARKAQFAFHLTANTIEVAFLEAGVRVMILRETKLHFDCSLLFAS